MRAIVQFFRQQLPRLWHYERVGITVFWLLLERVFNVGKMREGAGICHQLCHPLAKEFQREKLSLTHEPKEDFFRSQWQRQQKSLLWLIYRWLFAAVFTAGVVGSLIQTFGGGRWFIYLTDWGFFLCMFTGIFGAVLVTIYHFSEGSVDVPLWALKFYWASYWTTLSLATLITFIYWIFISPIDPQSPWALYNLWAHGFNSILMILDHMLVAFPVRILHYVFPLIVGVVYAVFTLIYYYAGGVDIYGNPYIYEILDWSKPGAATLTVFGTFVLTFIFGCIHFGLYKLKRFIYNKRSNTHQFTLNV
ncbi:protein rolling stone isoform X1 [Ceratitis capitata]|uniref:protein rolling stone isoform X1 n=2 Tax=Ceratitis capitata TaxID=7213 RepID=UPI00061889A8|nr:protein rolling stone isoform X1 [Ceratitis capitata]